MSSAPERIAPHLPPGHVAADLLGRLAVLLFANGQTTDQVVRAVGQAAGRLGVAVSVWPDWGRIRLRVRDGTGEWLADHPAAPSGVDMRKVAGGMAIARGLADPAPAAAALAALAALGPTGTARFALMAAAGAAALAVVFGGSHPAELGVIAAAAGVGAVVRRCLGRVTDNLFVQPLAAALIAGVVAALVLRLGSGVMSARVALCPCMVLVPGPHLLNGALDLLRGRLPLGIARMAYAGLTILMICIGLLLGAALAPGALPDAMPAARVMLPLDVAAAGVAVLAYGTFFSMPWAMLPIPVAVGMGAHAVRWMLMEGLGVSPALGALGACALAGVAMAPVSDRLHLPFAGGGFAAVVSLMPGVFLFQLAALLLQIAQAGIAVPAGLVPAAVQNAVMAGTILVAMAFGLLVPKLLFDAVMRRIGHPPPGVSRAGRSCGATPGATG